MTESAITLFNKGRMLFDSFRNIDAIPYLEESLVLDDHFKTRELLGECFEVAGDFDRALFEYTKAVELNPRSNRTCCLLGSLLFITGKKTEARDIIVEVLSRTPTYGPAKDLLSMMDSRSKSKRSRNPGEILVLTVNGNNISLQSYESGMPTSDEAISAWEKDHPDLSIESVSNFANDLKLIVVRIHPEKPTGEEQ